MDQSTSDEEETVGHEDSLGLPVSFCPCCYNTQYHFVNTLKRTLGGVGGTKSIGVHLGGGLGEEMFPPAFFISLHQGGLLSLFLLPAFPPSHLTLSHTQIKFVCVQPHTSPASSSIPLCLIRDIIMVAQSAALNAANRRSGLQLREREGEIRMSAALHVDSMDRAVGGLKIQRERILSVQSQNMEDWKSEGSIR